MRKVFLLLTIYCLLSISTPALAQTDYTLLAPIPLNVEGGCTGNANETCKTTPSPYIRGVFMLIIGLASGLAVVMIILGGIQYMSTDAFEGKNEAKNTIQNAIWGLLLAIGAWLILFTINPKLVEFDLSIPIQKTTTATTGGTPVPSAGCPTCVVMDVPHKSAPLGCAPPGPCTVDKTLNDKLVSLNQLNNLQVNESYPPSAVVSHQDPCHGNGTCVDVSTVAALTPSNVVNFVNNANNLGLNVLVEVSSAARVSAMVQAGVSASQVRITAGNGEHYHIKLK
ncbi:MAG: pilin [bacterium]|nr:pilin [bacterium]